MPNLDNTIATIRSAIYGKDVREAIAESFEELKDLAEETIEGAVRYNAAQALSNNEKNTALKNIGADMFSKNVVVRSQQELIEEGVYSDCDTIPHNQVVGYYCIGEVYPAHCPPLTYTGGARAIVASFSSTSRGSPNTGTVQTWYDIPTGKIYYRTSWESSSTFSDWNTIGANALIGYTNKYKFTGNSTINTNISAYNGVPFFVTGMCTNVTGKLNMSYEVYGIYGSSSDCLVQFGPFSGQPIIVVPQRDYDHINIVKSGDVPSGNYSLEVVLNTYENTPPIIMNQLLESSKKSGLLTRYSTKHQSICKFFGLSGKSGDILTVRAVKSNGLAKFVTIFGMHGLTNGAGSTNLGTVKIGQMRQFVLARDFAGFQAYNNTSSDVTSIEYEMEAGILDSGIQKDAIKRTSFNVRTCNIFHKVLCVGDSFTSGHIQLPSEQSAVGMNVDYAWPRFMEQLTGNEYINCGVSGATTISWQSSADGLAKAQNAGLVQAYIVGLMINDSGTVNNERRVPLGTASDIGTNNNTYYAQMSKIIRELNAISPLAKIFINTCPRNDATRYGGYNDAVREIVQTYKSTYPVHCIDLESDYYELYQALSINDDVTHDHLTAIGYEQLAEIYAYVLSDYINSHIADFQNIHKIPYGE